MADLSDGNPHESNAYARPENGLHLRGEGEQSVRPRKREVNIELLRCLFMLGICLCHSIGLSSVKCEPLRNIFHLCTTGFIFISGWYGVKLTIRKVAYLLCVGLYALAVVVVFKRWLFGEVVDISQLLRWGMDWWYLRAYLLLMFVSPLLNCFVYCAFHRDVAIRRNGWMSIVLIWLFVYGYAWPIECGVQGLPRFSISSIGNSHSVGMMSAVYLLGRVCRMSNVADRFCNKKLCLMLLCATTCLLGALGMCLTKCNSLNASVFSVAAFSLFKTVKVRSKFFEELVLYIAPSMFVVYLYHTTSTPGFERIVLYEKWLTELGAGRPLMWVSTALTIFVLGIVVDVPRRIVMRSVAKLSKYFGGENVKRHVWPCQN